VDTFILVIALLVGHIGDQFLVDTTLDIGQINGAHAWIPSQSDAVELLSAQRFRWLEEPSAGAAVQGESCAVQRVGLGRQQLSYRPADLVDRGHPTQR